MSKVPNYYLQTPYPLFRAHSNFLEPKDLFNDELSVTEMNSISDILHSIKDEYRTDETIIETMKQISKGWETPHTKLPPSVRTKLVYWALVIYSTAKRKPFGHYKLLPV